MLNTNSVIVVYSKSTGLTGSLSQSEVREDYLACLTAINDETQSTADELGGSAKNKLQSLTISELPFKPFIEVLGVKKLLWGHDAVKCLGHDHWTYETHVNDNDYVWNDLDPQDHHPALGMFSFPNSLGLSKQLHFDYHNICQPVAQ